MVKNRYFLSVMFCVSLIFFLVYHPFLLRNLTNYSRAFVKSNESYVFAQNHLNALLEEEKDLTCCEDDKCKSFIIPLELVILFIALLSTFIISIPVYFNKRFYLYNPSEAPPLM